jgi:hypothetical protein
MSEHAKSKAGAYSLGGMSVVDLICGMNDRILGDKFNGGNFMFDPAKKEFWCVDNAKDPKLALSFKNEDSWKNWVVELMTLGEGVTDRGQGIGEHIHWALYTRKTEDTRELSQNIVLDPAAAGATAAGIDEAVADTLRSLQALAKDDTNGLPKTERDKLRSRLAFVDRRMKFAALLKFDPQFSEVPSAKNPWVGKKVGRLLTSAVVGRSDEEKTAEAWKTKARNSQTSDQDLDALDATISTYLTNHPDADQRVLKALFAARSERLLRSLNAKIAVLAVLPRDDKAWGDLAPSVVTGIKAMTDQWVTKLRELDDKAAAVELQEAVTKFASLLPGATPAQ